MAFNLTAAGAHRVLVRYHGPEEAKYLPGLVHLLNGPTVGWAVLTSTLPANTPDTDLPKEARKFACDLVLIVRLEHVKNKERVTWSLSSPEETSPRMTNSAERPQPDWASAADLFWRFLSAPLSAMTSDTAPDWPAPNVAQRTELIVIAKPGTLVTGLPGGSHKIGALGRLSMSLDLPVSLGLEGHLVGWKTSPQRVFVDHAGQTVTLHQVPVTQWSLTLSLNNLVFPSLGSEWSPRGGRLSIRAALDQYMGGLLLTNRANIGSTSLPFQSLPLLTFMLGAGWNWSWPEDPIQFYTTLDAGVRFMFPQYKVFWVEPIIPVIFQPQVGWDYRFAKHQSVYLEVGPTIEWVTDSSAFQSSLKKDTNNAQIGLFGPLYMEFPLHVKVGYRWSF